MALRYKNTERDRNSTLRSTFKNLIKSKHIVVANEQEIEFLISATALIARFWVSESAVSHNHLPPEKQSMHYLSMISKLMSPYYSDKGQKQAQSVISSLNNA